MFATNPRRLRELRFIRMRALGASARAAARHAGYHEHGSHHVERRLKAEVEARKAQLRGMNGRATWKVSKRDAHRVLDTELSKIVDTIGPGRSQVQRGVMAFLAECITLSAARDHLSRIGSKLTREAKSYAPSPRTLQLRLLCRELVTRIERQKGAPAAGEDLASAGKPSSGKVVSQTGAHARAHEGAREAADRCPTHPSQPRACRLCQFTSPPEHPVPGNWGGQDW